MVPRPSLDSWRRRRHEGEQVPEASGERGQTARPGGSGGPGLPTRRTHDGRRASGPCRRRPLPPIFVIGSPRSGTTLLRLLLDSHPRISCGEETHFLRDLEAIVGRDWPLVASYGLPRDWWLARIRGLYGDFQAEVLARSGKARWAEKDPTYTLHLAFIEELFPDALFVHLLRDGHDVVASFRDRWGYRSAARAARTEWARYVERRHGRSAGAWTRERFLELRYERLVADPEAEARRLFDFLGEAWHPEVLDFDPADHAATERYRWFTAQRREAGGETATIYRSRVGAGGRSLDPVLRTLLRRQHGDAAARARLPRPSRTAHERASGPCGSASCTWAASAAGCGATGPSWPRRPRDAPTSRSSSRTPAIATPPGPTCARPPRGCATPTSCTSSGSWPTGVRAAVACPASRCCGARCACRSSSRCTTSSRRRAGWRAGSRRPPSGCGASGATAASLVVHCEDERARLAGFVPGGARSRSCRTSWRCAATCPTVQAARAALGVADRRVVTLLGYLTRRRGHGLVIDALRDLPQDVTALFVGSVIEGRDHVADELRAHAADIGVADRVRFMGYLPEAELEQVLVATDVALCPFRFMSASGALATWISAGRPIVASDLAPIRELDALAPGALRRFAPYEAPALAAAIRDALDEATSGPDPRVEALAAPAGHAAHRGALRGALSRGDGPTRLRSPRAARWHRAPTAGRRPPPTGGRCDPPRAGGPRPS